MYSVFDYVLRRQKRRRPNVNLMLGKRLRRWTSSKPTLDGRLAVMDINILIKYLLRGKKNIRSTLSQYWGNIGTTLHFSCNCDHFYIDIDFNETHAMGTKVAQSLIHFIFKQWIYNDSQTVLTVPLKLFIFLGVTSTIN